MKPQRTKIRESVPLIQIGIAHKCYAWWRVYSRLGDDGSWMDCKEVGLEIEKEIGLEIFLNIDLVN